MAVTEQPAQLFKVLYAIISNCTRISTAKYYSEYIVLIYKIVGVIGVQLGHIYRPSFGSPSKNKFVHNSTPASGSTPTIRQNKRPFSATLLTWVVLILASLGWLQLITVLRGWSFLQSLSPTPPLFYLAITGLIWGLLGTFLVWGLFLGRPWAPRLMQISAPIYAAAYWFDRLLIAKISAIASRWPFVLGLTILLLGFTFWALSRPKVRYFYQNTGS